MPICDSTVFSISTVFFLSLGIRLRVLSVIPRIVNRESSYPGLKVKNKDLHQAVPWVDEAELPELAELDAAIAKASWPDGATPPLTEAEIKVLAKVGGKVIAKPKLAF